MTWFKVDDSFHSHPKAMAASLAALGLWSVAGSWSSKHHTDGFIPDHMIPSLARGQSELAKELCAAGLWKRSKGGYLFHQWDADGDGTVRNPTREEVTVERRKMSSGGALGNHRRWHVDKGKSDPRCRYCQQRHGPPPDPPTDRVPDRVAESAPNPPDPSRPVPTREEHKNTPPASPGPPTGSRPDRGSRLPDDFQVTEEMADWARANAPACGPADHEAFCDYWRSVPGAKGRKVNWVMTWRNWMRREQERRSSRPNGHAPPGARPSTADQRVADIQALKAEMTGNAQAPLLNVIRGELA